MGGGEFAGFMPDDLVDWQRKHQGEYELLDLVQRYIMGKEGTYQYKARCYGAVRSFFLHNRCELPRDRAFSVKGTKAAVAGRLSVDEFKRVLAACNPLYRAVFLCMLQGGMGVGERLFFDEFGLKEIRRQMDRGDMPVRVELPGRKKLKNVKPYYTFLGGDAVDALKVWFLERPSEAGSRVFVTQFGWPLSYSAMQMYWEKKLSDLGLITRLHNNDSGNRYGKNLHEIRDLFKTRWRVSGVDIELGDYFMGHDIDSLGYDKSPRDYPDYYRERYRDAMSWLNVLSEEPDKVPRLELDKVKRETEIRLRVLEEYVKEDAERRANEMIKALKEVK